MFEQIKSNRYALWAVAIGVVLLVVSIMSRTEVTMTTEPVEAPDEEFFAEPQPAPAKKKLVVSEAMVDVMMEAALRENPSLRESELEIRREFLKGLVAQEMMVAEAIDMGLAATDPITRNRLSELIMLTIYQRADTGVTDEAIRAYYNSNRHKYKMPEKRRVQHLFVRVTNVTDDKKAQETLDRLFKEARGPESDRSKVVKAAIDPRWIAREELRTRFGPSLTEWLFALEVGDWSEPYRSTSGWHKVRIMEESAERIRDFDEVRAEVEADLRQSLRLGAYEREMERLSRKFEVIVNP